MAFQGALVIKAADLMAVNIGGVAGGDLLTGGTLMTWDSEVYDTDNFHDNASNPGRLTIPPSIGGAAVVLTANIFHTAISAASQTSFLSFRKNGTAAVPGNVYSAGNIVEVATSGTTSSIQIQSAPINVVAGDYFECWHMHNDASLNIESDRSSFGIRVVPPASPLPTFQGVLCTKAADQIGVNLSALTAIAWDGADSYDTDAAHNPAANNTKIIIPAAWNNKYGVFTTNITLNNVTGNVSRSIKIQRGGVDGWNGFGAQPFNAPALNPLFGCCVTQAVLLATGQEYEAKIMCSDTIIDVLAASSSFGCRIVG